MSSNKRILVVDDEKMNIMALAHFLKPQYDIIVATNGTYALEAAAKHIPDMILLDVILPDLSGYEVIASLKNSEATRNIPVIFISGLIDAADKEKGLSLGAVDFIPKPLNEHTVKETVKNHLK